VFVSLCVCVCVGGLTLAMSGQSNWCCMLVVCLPKFVSLSKEALRA